MAFCAHCGKQIPDDAKFCDGCGQPIIGGSGFAEQFNNDRGFGTYQENVPPERNFVTPVVSRIRTVGGSTLELVLIILTAASVVMSFIAGGSSSMIPGVGGAMIGLSLIGSIPTILMIIGLLLFFFDCRKNPIPRGSGLGVYKAAKIVMIVFLAIIGIVAVLGMVLGGVVVGGLGGSLSDILDELLSEAGISSAAFSYGGAVAGAMAGVLIVILIFVAIILILAILMQIKLMHCANVVRKTLASGVRSGTIPVYPAVIQILISIGMVISLFNTIGQAAAYASYLGSAYSGLLAVSVIQAIVTCAQAIITIIMLLKLRAAVNQAN